MLGTVDCVVVGGGVVGLACARAIAQSGCQVMVLEAERSIGQHCSGRSSEVVHAGIYYPPGSLKARLCVSGRHLLYPFMETHNIAYRRCGKLITATSVDEVSVLEGYRACALANGVDDLRWLEEGDVRRYEPELRAVAGLLSPSTGILDSHALLLALRGDAEAAGADLALRARVVRVARAGREFRVVAEQGRQQFTLGCRQLVNAAGLGAWAVARAIEGLPAKFVPAAYYAAGHYMTYSGGVPFQRLIYPVAQAGGLGIHLTLDLAGQARFGPDVEWRPAPDYRFTPDRLSRFSEAIRRYWPALDANRLQPGYVGVRPKLAGPDSDAEDFAIQTCRHHGVEGLVQLFGIESPGLTASLAIGEYVLRALGLEDASET